MAKNLLDQAQIVMDSFYQEFAPANAFFSLDDFAQRIADCRDSELEREFLIQYQQNKLSFPIVNPAWLSRETVEIKKDEEGNSYADVCTPLYEFPFDSKGSGVQEVIPMGTACAEFIRIAFDQVWQVCMAPSNSVNFYSVEKCRIWLHNFYACTDKLMVLLVPSQSGLSFEKQSVPDGKAESIRELVLNRMWRDYQVKLGKIVTHTDGNPNPQPNETGLLYEGLKTK